MMETVTLRWRDLNGRGNGSAGATWVILPNANGDWSRAERGWGTDMAVSVTGSWLPIGQRADNRHCMQKGKVPIGSVVVEFEHTYKFYEKASRVAEVRAYIVGGGDIPYRGVGLNVKVQVDGEWLSLK